MSDKRVQMLIDRNTTHGMSKRLEYSNWKDIKRRCFNKNNKRYADYALRGISVHPDFVDSFPKFLKEIGNKPEGKGWSVGRIDNNGWYTYGNIRWETLAEQARNHSKQSNNTSGITGISRRSKIISCKVYSSRIATWSDPKINKSKSKSFSCEKYGEEAFKLACEHRKIEISNLSLLGIVYGNTHGANKYE